MPVEDPWIRVVEDRRLDAPPKQRLGLAHEVLVEGVLARDQHREPVAAAPGTAPLLPEARHRAREAGRDHAVEQADVDPELECVGRRDSEQLAGREPLLDLPALRRGVAGAVGESRSRYSWPSRSRVKRWISSADLRLFAKQSVRRPRSTSCAISRDASPSALARDAELLVEQRRVPERDRPLGPRRGVVLDDGEVDSDECPAELRRVRDRRRGEQELRVGSVYTRHSAEPAQHVADVRAEDAAVDVRLVDDHVGEVREHVAPAVVVGEDADVEHVRVREHEVRPLADLPPPLHLRVAVVDRRLHARHLQLLERAQLVLGERLRRVEVDRTLLRLRGEGVEHGQVERERLPARGARDDRDVLSARGRRPGVRLVLVELLDAARLERSPHLRVQLVGKGRGASLARGLTGDVCELLSFEDPRPRRQLDRHPDEGSVRP